jgi:hypothetical protein
VLVIGKSCSHSRPHPQCRCNYTTKIAFCILAPVLAAGLIALLVILYLTMTNEPSRTLDCHLSVACQLTHHAASSVDLPAALQFEVIGDW